jgi:hypothetical protein
MTKFKNLYSQLLASTLLYSLYEKIHLSFNLIINEQ